MNGSKNGCVCIEKSGEAEAVSIKNKAISFKFTSFFLTFLVAQARTGCYVMMKIKSMKEGVKKSIMRCERVLEHKTHTFSSSSIFGVEKHECRLSWRF